MNIDLDGLAEYFGFLAWTNRIVADEARARKLLGANAPIVARNLGMTSCPRTWFGEPVCPGDA